nr:MAG: GDSL-like Lipase/Acylhydrolase family protein [Bacteriophage sp.]
MEIGLNETNLVTDDKIGDKNSVDDTTWWGAWNKVLEYYITNMPYCKIGIIIADAWFHKTLRDELIKIANYWGIPYLDLKGDLQVPMMLDGRYDNSIVNSKAIQLRNKAFQTSNDDHHPNPKCHLYRSTIIENFLRQL